MMIDKIKATIIITILVWSFFMSSCASTEKKDDVLQTVDNSSLQKIETNDSMLLAEDTSTDAKEDDVDTEVETPILQDEIELQDNPDIQHVVIEGESLWKISEYEHIYNNPLHWRKIYEANKNVIKHPDLIYPDQSFTIPAVEGDGNIEK